MIELECPKCERIITFTFAADEDWAHKPCLEVDQIMREPECEVECVLSKEEINALCERAIDSEKDSDPPGDY